ncbi:hypothetical protein ACRQ1B_06125 [Rhizobium panacihumi]|uniref:hypothetical protein n=1 Tax=Rhizobium panacihumi TaxID=2008450 RepID=UPI003D7926DF
MTDRNKIIEDTDDLGSDWRADAASSLERDDPEKAAKRSRGRPKGSMNRKTQDFSAWYDAQGYKDPLQLQAEFMSADPVALQAFYIEHERTQKAIGKMFGKAVPALSDIVKAQMDCAKELAPYLHGKAPAREAQDDERLPVLVINAGTNQIEQAQLVHAKSLSVGRPLVELTASKINDLTERDGKNSTPHNSKDAK